jgi:hypothetical protein
VICREARSRLEWRGRPVGLPSSAVRLWLRRIDLVARHRRRFTGDSVSPTTMMVHPVVLATAFVVARVSER